MTSANALQITTANVAEYLRRLGLLEAGVEPFVEEFGGGVSSTVIRIVAGGLDVVVKQPLELLRTAQEWRYDRGRMLAERTAMEVLGRILPEGCSPRLIASDEANFVIVMSTAPPGGVVWKQALMRGDIRPETARHVGMLLGRLHARAPSVPDLDALFPSKANFIEGRIQPYFETAAALNPDVEPVLRAETERLLASRRTLVHGDFSPKNMIAYPGGVMLLDHEVAHVGDPSFDIGFVLTHLSMKALCLPQWADALMLCARTFWRAYAETAPVDGTLEQNASRQFGALILARVDGKSRLEYLDDETRRGIARRCSKELLLDPGGTVDGALDLLRAAAINSNTGARQ